MNDGNHGQRTRSAKKGSDGSAENTPNTSKFIRPICPIGLKFWDIDDDRNQDNRYNVLE